MRKSEYLQQQLQPRTLNPEYLPTIAKEWSRHGYSADYLLDENDGFYNILEDYHKSKDELKKLESCKKGKILLKGETADDYRFMVQEDISVFWVLFKYAKLDFCGFYDVKNCRYFSQDEVARYAQWFIENNWCSREIFFKDFKEMNSLYNEREREYCSILDKYTAFLCNIAALLIALDVSQYLDEKKVSGKTITEKNVTEFVKYGPYAGQVFDPEKMAYRKVRNFDDFAYAIHTQFWFHDPAKGYHTKARYKWNPDVPALDEL